MNGRRESSLPKLVKKVKSLEFINSNEVLQLHNLSAEIFNEWRNVRNKYRKQIQNKKINDRVYAKLEAEEEIVVGLLSLLNEKIINFINPIFDVLFNGKIDRKH